MALIDPEDLVHDAFLKVLVGQDRPNAGRHISGRYRHDVSDFLVAIKGIINSDLSHLTRDAIGQPELVTYSDEEPENIDPTRREQFDDLLARRDLQAVLFTELFKQVPIDSAMHTVIEDWEERFLDDNRVGSKGDNPNVVHRVRVLAREIISQVEPDLLPSAA